MLSQVLGGYGFNHLYLLLDLLSRGSGLLIKGFDSRNFNEFQHRQSDGCLGVFR